MQLLQWCHNYKLPVGFDRPGAPGGVGNDIAQIKTMTVLLGKFNKSGITNDFPAGLAECSPGKASVLRKLARDPTTQVTCPGLNENAAQAWSIVSFPFSQSVNLTKYTNDFPGSTCGTSGPDAVWKIEPQIGLGNARFTVGTFGSNFDTVLSVWVPSRAASGGVYFSRLQ